MSVAIRIQNLWKLYRLGVYGHGMLFRDLQSWAARIRNKEDPNSTIDSISGNGRRTGGTVWALRDVSLDIEQGEVLGIIGGNGAGKSTLLKIISKVTAPTRGEVKIKGRVASLLEVGTGFHPELTGRENVFLNGAILGMTKTEIRSKFDEIVDFSGVEKYIDTPVKRYSSGMKVRLAFSVAAHLEPEILVIDEVLAVGDSAFQKKCMGKMESVSQTGRTILFVSHRMAAINNLCTRCIALDRGKMMFNGDTSVTVRKYLEMSMGSEQIDSGCVTFEPKPELPAQILEAKIVNSEGLVSPTVRYQEGFEFQIRLAVNCADSNYYTVVLIEDEIGNVVVYTCDNDLGPALASKLEPGIWSFGVPMPARLFKPGSYYVTFSITRKGSRACDLHWRLLRLHVEDHDSWRSHINGYRQSAIVAPEISWKLNPSDPSVESTAR